MIKQMKLGYTGMSKDLSKDKQSQRYYNAKNIRILATDQPSSFSVTNEHGNELVFDIPIPVFNRANTSIDYIVNGTLKSLSYTISTGDSFPRNQLEENYHPGNEPALTSGPQVIIGTKDLRDSAIIITTDDNGFDCFWELTNLNNGSFDLELRYMNDLSLSKEKLIQIEYNYENSLIEKIYFVDGANQLRFMNLRQSIANGDSLDLVDVKSSSIDTVSDFNISQIDIENVVNGGNHTSGMIQYAYNLYILNGSQTKISPLSPLIPLDKGPGLGGGELNEVVGKTVVLNIPNVDDDFSHIKLYSIKYTSLNEQPEVSLIADKQIDNFTSFVYHDDGSILESMSLEAFAFLGSDPIIPKHIVAKDSRLFYVNVKEYKFNLDLDTRAYAHDSNGNAVVWENVSLLPGTSANSEGTLVGSEETIDTSTYELDETHDAINRDYDTYMFTSDGSTFGGEGKYIKLIVDQTNLPEEEAKRCKFLKDREVYRIAIEFYNKRGQKSDPYWIMDLKAPSGNLEDKYNKLVVEFKPEFYVWLNTESNFDIEDDKPVGYRILRADRQLKDKTILTQGMINPMVANIARDRKDTAFPIRRSLANSDEAIKLPSATRMFQTASPFVKNKDYHELSWASENNSHFLQLGQGADRECYKARSRRDYRAQTFQFNKLIQMHSPETLFFNPQVDASHKLNIVGLARKSYFANWATETQINTGIHDVAVKYLNHFNQYTPGVSINTSAGNHNDVNDHSFYGPTENSDAYGTNHIYKEFRGGFEPSNGDAVFDIYGSPELTEMGSPLKPYNGDYSLRYSNSLRGLLQDDFRRSSNVNNDAENQIQGLNSWGARCITFAEGPDESSFDLNQRKSIEDMYALSGINNTDGILIAEFVKDKNSLYIGNLYGGNTYESKSITNYIGIGEYQDINNNNVLIKSPGDTFVQEFKFTKIVKTDTQIYDTTFNQLTEIVSFKCETSVDLVNRNDISNNSWDNRWHPRYEEYHKYNNVYSQQPTLIQSLDEGFKFKEVKRFDTRVMASKVKIPGEFIDNWTDTLINETIDLDGKYGPINAVVNFKDEIYTLQDSGVAHLSINPRVQTTGSDGVAIQLGTGQVLHDYQYLTTNSGCLNKWGVVNTQNGFYYFDLLNKTIVAYQGGIKGISDEEGFHSFFVREADYALLSLDNPVLNTGVSCGYNPVNNDVYFSFHKSRDKFTISYNEATRSFVSFYDYAPAWYINKGSRMITTNPDHNQVWEHFRGLKNYFYGKYYPSSITFNAAPEGDRDHIFNNLHYKMEMTDPTGQDLPLVGLNQVRIWNDYQDSGVVNLVLRDNVNRKFRHWKLNLPRNKDSRDRIRNPWAFIQLILNNDDANNMVLHDLTLHYTEY